ncbi:hypothetical protein BCR35DRAFT_332813 [Leucosporidium creatinivorum]|uniref:Uncharacterized protein n=1 Tax=Leucosporidium creatinivorum TaxID=106004 RepID=A0A1Y2EYJ7_9BASI|nr:hypothetical protein BCR35DRAFT_332813 [Leucosporidium creatinivorum]
MSPWSKTAVAHQPPSQPELAAYPRHRASSEIPEQERAPLVAHSLIASSSSSIWAPNPLSSTSLQQHRRHPSSSSTHSQLARFAHENRRPPSPTGSTRTTSSAQSSYSSLFNSGMSNLRGLTVGEEDRLKLKEDSEAPVRERWERERESSMRGGALGQQAVSGGGDRGKGIAKFKSLLKSSDSAQSVRSAEPSTPTSITASAGGSMYLPSPPSSPPPPTAPTTSSSSLSNRRMYPSSPTPSVLSITPRPSPSPSPSHFLLPHPSPALPSPTSSFASSTPRRLASKTSALSLSSEEQTAGGLRGKAARILGEEIVPSGKAAKVLGVQKEVGGVGRKLKKEMPRERREVVERIRQSPHLAGVPLPSNSPHSSPHRPSPSHSPTPIPVAHSRAPPPPPLWLPLPPPAGAIASNVTTSPSLASLASTSTSSTSARSVGGDVGDWGARQVERPALPLPRDWRENEEEGQSGCIDSPSFSPSANPKTHQTRLNLALASLAAVGAARTPQQASFDRSHPPTSTTSTSISPTSTPSPSFNTNERPHLCHRSSDVDPALSLSLERQIRQSNHSNGLHLSIFSTSSYGIPSDVEFYATPSDSQEEGSSVRGKLPSLASSGRGKGSGGTTPIEESIEEEKEGQMSASTSPGSPSTYFSSSPVLARAPPLPLPLAHSSAGSRPPPPSSSSALPSHRPTPHRKPSIPPPPLPPKSTFRPTSSTLARSNTLVSVASSRTRGFQRGNALEALEGRRGAPPPYPSSTGGRGERAAVAGRGERVIERSRPMGPFGEVTEGSRAGEKEGVGGASALKAGSGGAGAGGRRGSRWFLDWSDDSGDEATSPAPQSQLQPRPDQSRQPSQWSSSSGSASAVASSPVDSRAGSGSGSGGSARPARETMMTISSPLDPFFAREVGGRSLGRRYSTIADNEPCASAPIDPHPSANSRSVDSSSPAARSEVAEGAPSESCSSATTKSYSTTPDAPSDPASPTPAAPSAHSTRPPSRLPAASSASPLLLFPRPFPSDLHRPNRRLLPLRPPPPPPSAAGPTSRPSVEVFPRLEGVMVGF